jgi:hypothetical protein
MPRSIIIHGTGGPQPEVISYGSLDSSITPQQITEDLWYDIKMYIVIWKVDGPSESFGRGSQTLRISVLEEVKGKC